MQDGTSNCKLFWWSCRLKQVIQQTGHDHTAEGELLGVHEHAALSSFSPLNMYSFVVRRTWLMFGTTSPDWNCLSTCFGMQNVIEPSAHTAIPRVPPNQNSEVTLAKGTVSSLVRGAVSHWWPWETVEEVTMLLWQSTFQADYTNAFVKHAQPLEHACLPEVPCTNAINAPEHAHCISSTASAVLSLVKPKKVNCVPPHNPIPHVRAYIPRAYTGVFPIRKLVYSF